MFTKTKAPKAPPRKGGERERAMARVAAGMKMMVTQELSIFFLALLLGWTRAAKLSNIALPRDQHGEKLITGEASVLEFEGEYYFYVSHEGCCR